MLEYRNIDTHADLKKFARKYHQGDISETQMRHMLSEKGYSEREINNAIWDYDLVYIRSRSMMEWLLAVSLAAAILVAVLRILSFG